MPTKKIPVYNVDSYKNSMPCIYDEVSVCPICDHALVPQPLSGWFVSDTEGATISYCVSILYFCTRCRETFLVDYNARCENTGISTLVTTTIRGIYPLSVKTTVFSQAISEMSPMFVTAYTQSEIAESEHLTEIAGCGYRKSVEYLVKDYLCNKLPDDTETIKAEFLGNAIKRIEDGRIKILAERSTWLGNDETHYVRKHEDHDVEDMKRFIKAMVTYIDSELALEEALGIPFKK